MTMMLQIMPKMATAVPPIPLIPALARNISSARGNSRSLELLAVVRAVG